MSRFLKWRYGVALGVVALIAVACSEAAKNPVAPGGSGEYVPRFAAVDPANGVGACMGDDAFASGFTSGLGSATSLNCTANDIEIALATFTEATVDGVTYHAGDVISCNVGDSVDLVMDAQLLQNANSARTDIGIWIARDGGDAETGSCQHYNLPNSLDGVFNLDSTQASPDNCGDMNAQDSTVSVSLGTVRVACQTAPGAGDSLHIGACLGWTQPGGDQQCPIGHSQTPQAYRYGTVPANKSKCNCDGFNLPITVNRFATIEVKKVCAPTSDGGTFDLKIDGTTQGTGNDAPCGGTTGAVQVSAGTSGSPGASHSVIEDGFTTANYTSSFVCTQNGHALSNGTGTNAGSINALPDSAYVCTFTNSRQPTLTVNKVCAPTTDGGAFNLQIDGATQAGGNTACQGTTGAVQVTVGSHTVGETQGTSTDLTDYTSVIGGDCASNGTVTLAAGDTKTCTITNTKKASLTLAKHVINDDAGTSDASAWTLTATGTSGGFSGTGLPATGADASLGPNFVTIGVQYTLSESGPSGYTASAWVCTGGGSFATPDKITLAAGDSVTCTITNDDDEPVPSNGRILPTATTCEDYASANATDLTTLLATLGKNNKIGTVSPGVFFYYATVTKTGTQSIGFTQTVTSYNTPALPKYVVQQTQAFLYTYNGSSCTRVATLTLSAGGTAGSDGTSLPAGTYILGVKFATDAPKGTTVQTSLRTSGSLLATHFYQATVGGSGQATTNASVNTNVK